MDSELLNGVNSTFTINPISMLLNYLLWSCCLWLCWKMKKNLLATQVSPVLTDSIVTISSLSLCLCLFTHCILSCGLAHQALAVNSAFNSTFPRFKTRRAKRRVMNSSVYLVPQSVCTAALCTHIAGQSNRESFQRLMNWARIRQGLRSEYLIIIRWKFFCYVWKLNNRLLFGLLKISGFFF